MTAVHPRGPLLDVIAAAQYLGTSPRHIRRLIAERRIAFVRIGGKVRLCAADLDTLVEQATVPVVGAIGLSRR